MQLSNKNEQKNVVIWCFFLSSTIWVMVILGGVTRLTGSGLSIVEWSPIMGTLPPLTAQDWTILFQKYQTTPEFIHVNTHFSLQEFKEIFWLEYIHRLWGRLIGLFFLLPWGYFLITKKISNATAWKLLGLFILGLIQGGVGWYMVKSGLVENPAVSAYRLAFHLMLATFIYVGFLVLGFQHMRFEILPKLYHAYYPKKLLKTTLLLLLLTILWGAFVAGNKAGLIYNTFPKMDQGWLPDGWLSLTPFWLNFIENHGTIQFAHRIFAITTLGLSGILWYQARLLSPVTGFFALSVLGQVGLGITTLCLHVPVFWATVHQAWALITLGFGVFLWNRWCRWNPNVPRLQDQVAGALQ